MSKKIILAFSLCLIAFVAHAQMITIHGRVVDKKTGNPVIEAQITSKTGEMAVTDDAGNFSLSIPKVPTILHITHVSYGISEYEVTAAPKGLLTIGISENIVDIDEVQISAGRLRSLTRQDPYSVQAFAVEGQRIWFLGFMNNQSNLQRLFLANLYGDTLASVPVKGAETLFQDVFQTVHIVFGDSVYQLNDPGGKRIEFLYPESKSRFYGIMADLELSIDQKLVFAQLAPGTQTRRVYYIQEGDPVRYLLTVISDTVAANSQRQADKIDWLMDPERFNVPELYNIWSTIWRYSKRGSKFEKVIRNDAPYGLFTAHDELYVINFLKDSLLIYTAGGKFREALAIDFHKETTPAGVKYRKITCLTDPVTQKVYILEHQLARLVLRPLNPLTGKAENPVRLPDYPGMTGTCVYDGAVYFIYQERIHPYYTRLYRYQL